MKLTNDFWRHVAVAVISAAGMATLGALDKIDWSILGPYAVAVPVVLQVATEAFNQFIGSKTS